MSKSGRILVFVVLTSVLLLLFLGQPGDAQWPIKCPLYWATGWQCPLCGSQRFVHECLHGHCLTAFHYNPWLVVLLPYLAVLSLGQVSARCKTLKVVQWAYHNRVIGIMFFLTLTWGIVRNVCLFHIQEYLQY